MSEVISFADALRRRQERERQPQEPSSPLLEETKSGKGGSEEARRPFARGRFWRSDDPITLDRWILARQAKGYNLADFAAVLGVTDEHLTAIEQGREQPSEAEQAMASRLTGMLPAWFHLPPMEGFGPGSLDWHAHEEWYVCDPCERDCGGHIAPEDEWAYRAVDRCIQCRDDLCEAHRWVEEVNGDKRTQCDRCHRKRVRETTAALKRPKRNT